MTSYSTRLSSGITTVSHYVTSSIRCYGQRSDLSIWSYCGDGSVWLETPMVVVVVAGKVKTAAVVVMVMFLCCEGRKQWRSVLPPRGRLYDPLAAPHFLIINLLDARLCILMFCFPTSFAVAQVPSSLPVCFLSLILSQLFSTWTFLYINFFSLASSSPQKGYRSYFMTSTKGHSHTALLKSH